MKELNSLTLIGTTLVHWKDVVKLDLYRQLYGGSFRVLEEKFGWYKSNYGEALGWIKYKSEGFHKLYLTSLDEKTRYMVSATYSQTLDLKLLLSTIPEVLCI